MLAETGETLRGENLTRALVLVRDVTQPAPEQAPVATGR
jgi:hypothetical protein